MSAGTPEFSRLVPLARVGRQPLRQEIAATEGECAALARRFDLVALDRLAATVELVRSGADTILLHAEFEADFVQTCVVTLDPVGGALKESFALRYGPPASEAGDTDPGGDAAFEPLLGEAIDIGEAVAQEFSLALPPFPRSPEADGDTAAEQPQNADPAALPSRGEGSQR